MRKRMALNGLALLGLLASTNVLAEIQPGFYAGVGVGTATIELDTIEVDDDFDFKFDADDTAFKVFGGYNFNQYFAIEATYYDGGEQEETIISFPGFNSSIEVGTSGLIASAIGRVPLGDLFSLYGKLGFASYDAEIKTLVNGDVVFEEDGSDDDVAYGVGASFNIGSQFELRAEYEAISLSDGDFTLLSVNGLFKF
ncbi:porin family protein [Peristeroidobacter agariperforans]|uniref:porin family protein n=1 Tax=Peristeroidobacter agariperforans TaxID=268404 RepID=UPI00101BB9FF|nr:porin family protein [Peristeroidobacter agariperforans]